jgi:pimeloyl-ACP methyl ester carboxylesterase
MIKTHNTDGNWLAYTDRGEGDTLVLLHGYLESLMIFEDLAEKLSQNFRVITIDLPGHGQSEIVSDCHTMEMMAGRVNTLLEYLEADRVLLIGHSLGGYVTLAFLELFPERLAGYCLFHSHPFADPPAAIERRKREIAVVLAGKKHIMYPGNIRKMFSPDNIASMVTEIDLSDDIASHTPDGGIIAVLNGMMIRPSRKRIMEESAIPLLWILGIHDQYIDFNSATADVTLPVNGSLAVLYHSGHLGFIEEPERTEFLLKEFSFTVFGEETRA